MPIFKSIKPGASLKNIIKYVSKEFDKTKDVDTIKGLNVADNPDIAKAQMIYTKKEFGKETGRQYQHYVLSFSDEEKLKPKEAIAYAEKHAKECFGDRFQVFLAVHQNGNGGKLHVHYVVNSVSYIDGKKIQTSKDDYDYFKNINDEIAKEYGFKVIDRSYEAVRARGRPQLYGQREYQSFIRNKNNLLSNCGISVFKALQDKPKSFDDFKNTMQGLGWEVHLRGKNIVFKNVITQQRIRANTLAKKINNNKLSTALILKACNEQSWKQYQVISVKAAHKHFDNNQHFNHLTMKLPYVNTNDEQQPKAGFKVDLQQDYERD